MLKRLQMVCKCGAHPLYVGGEARHVAEFPVEGLRRTPWPETAAGTAEPCQTAGVHRVRLGLYALIPGEVPRLVRQDDIHGHAYLVQVTGQGLVVDTGISIRKDTGYPFRHSLRVHLTSQLKPGLSLPNSTVAL